MTYSEKLKNPKWQKKRLKILERDKFTCTLCGDKETELHVHHNSYKGDPWDVDNKELKTVCKHCHLVLHEFDNREVKVYKYFYDNCNIWSIAVLDRKILSCFLYNQNDPNGLENSGVFNIECFSKLYNHIKNG